MNYSVRELYDKLQDLLGTHEEDYIVVLQGCDCYGNWDGEITVEQATKNKQGNIVLGRF